MKNIRILQIDPVLDDRWDRYAGSHRNAVIYHHSAWLETLRQTYGYELLCLAVENETHELEGILPTFFVNSRLTGKRMISLPFSPFCGPLAENGSAGPLLDRLHKYAEEKKAGHIQIRCLRAIENMEEHAYITDLFYRVHLLDLSPDMDTLLSNYHESCIRRPFMKSLKNGMDLRLADSEADVRAFYELQVRTRKKHGIVPQPLDFFLNMWRNLSGRDLIRILLAQVNGKTIAGLILLGMGDTVIYHNGASDADYLHLKPNHFLIGKAIEMTKALGYKIFNFGTSTPVDTGLIQFKQRWGTEEQFLPYYYYPDITGVRTHIESSWKLRITSAVLRHLPAAILKKVGEFGYRHMA